MSDPKQHPPSAACTLTEIVAQIAYGADYDGRYDGPPHGPWTEKEARAVRRSDASYPYQRKLPGTEVLHGLKNRQDGAENGPDIFSEKLEAFQNEDRARWKRAQAELRSELQTGRITAYDEMGNAVNPAFWLANDVSSALTEALLLRRAEAETALDLRTSLLENDHPSSPLPASDRTGAPGRPTSRHRVLEEFERRLAANEVRPTLGEEAQTLAAWLRTTHPNLAGMTPKTIENLIRHLYSLWLHSK